MTNAYSRPVLINPFTRQVELYRKTTLMSKSYATFKSVCSIFLLPLRLLGMAFFITITNFFARLSLIGYKEKYNPETNDLEPFPKWRRMLFYPAAFSFRLAFMCMGFHYVRVKGTPSSREEAPIIIANHTSPFDPFYIALRHLPMIIARAEQKDTPLLGSLFAASQSLFVDRLDKDSRRKVAQAIKQRAKDDRFPQILLFPEGTTTNGTALVSFKTGAFIPGVPVQPIIIRYKDNKRYDLTWTPGISLVRLMIGAFCEFNNMMEIEYLPPYVPNEEEKNDPELYAEHVRCYMADHMNVPVTDHKLEDMLLLDRALKKNKTFKSAPELCISDLTKKYSKLKFEKNENHFFTLLKLFQEMDLSNNNKLDIHDFEKAMLRTFNKDNNLSVAVQTRFLNYSRKLFRLLSDEKGELDYRAFVLGIAPFMLFDESNDSNHEEFHNVAFLTFDRDQDGYISKNEFEFVLKKINPYWDQEQLDQLANEIFKELDNDHDQMLSFNEFSSGMKSNDYLKGIFETTRRTIQDLVRNLEPNEKMRPENIV